MTARKNRKKLQDCLMAGNDAREDRTAARTGMQVFLLTDCLINKSAVSARRV